MLLVENDVKMFNFSYAMVSLAAIIRKIDYTSTKITYTIEDHTGRMEAHYWLEDEGSPQPKITQNAYAKIVGALRKSGDQNVIIVYNAQEIEDPNELVTHMLETLYCRFKGENLSKGGGLTTGMSAGLGGMTLNHGNHNGTHMEMEDVKPMVASNGLTGKHAVMVEAINAANSTNGDSGISRQQVFAKFPKIPRDEVNQILDYLSNEGFIYSTINADHFKTVE